MKAFERHHNLCHTTPSGYHRYHRVLLVAPCVFCTMTEHTAASYGAFLQSLPHMCFPPFDHDQLLNLSSGVEAKTHHIQPAATTAGTTQQHKQKQLHPHRAIFLGGRWGVKSALYASDTTTVRLLVYKSNAPKRCSAPLAATTNVNTIGCGHKRQNNRYLTPAHLHKVSRVPQCSPCRQLRAKIPHDTVCLQPTAVVLRLFANHIEYSQPG